MNKVEKNIKKVLTVKNQHDIIFKLSVRDSEEHIVSKGFEKNVSKKN